MFNQGDRVVIQVGFDKPRLAIVERVTDTQAIVKGQRFRRQNGYLIGGGSWRNGHIRHPSEQDIKDITRRAMIRQCQGIEWQTLTDEQLAEVLSIVTAQAPDCTGTPDK